MNINLNKIVDIEFDGIDYSDTPDFVDAYISKAYIQRPNKFFRELTEKELDFVNEKRRDFVYEKLMKHLY